MPILQRRPRRVVEEEDEEPQQRPRQRQRRDDSETDADSDGTMADDSRMDDDATQQDETAETQLIKKLVRYALACEFSRTPIRREGIRERVLGSHGRSFRRILAGAQLHLQSVFGMELVELPVRDKETMSLGEKRKAAKSQSKGQSSSNAYILRTRIPEQYRSAAIVVPSNIISEEDEAAYVGVYGMLTALICLNGGSLSDAKLRRYLRRLNAAENMPGDKTDNALQKMIRQGYIVKTVDKRPDAEEESTTWSIGPRGKLEFGPEAVAGIVREVYGEATDELEARIRVSLGLGDGPLRAEESRVEAEVAAADTTTNEADETAEASGSRTNGPRRSRRRAGED